MGVRTTPPMKGPAMNRLTSVAVAVAFVVPGLLLAGCASSRSNSPSQEVARKKAGPMQQYQLARMYFEQGRVPDALEAIERALRADRSLPQLWFYRGYIHWTMERWDKAEADFREAIARNPYFTDARMYLATCLEKRGNPEGALTELDLALTDKTFPTPEQIWLNRALILRRMGRTEDALAALRESVTDRPRFYRGHYEMATLLAAMGRLDDAESAFAAAEAGYPKDAMFHFERGEVLYRLRRPQEAKAELRRAVELAPGSDAAAKAAQLLKSL